MPPPPNPPTVDEDETMDIVPDSEPSGIVDGPAPSLPLPGLISQAPTLVEDINNTVPRPSSDTDGIGPAHGDTSHATQGEKMQETELEAEQYDDPMDGDLPLANQRRRRPPKLILEEEQQVEQEVRDSATVPETEDEVPLATLVKPPKPTPKPLPPRGRSTRNKRPIVYTESPDTSENEVSATKLSSIHGVLKYVSGRRRNGRNTC